MHASTLNSDRSAETESPLLEVLANRWSPRAFDASEAIDETKLTSALEAARWSPSASNSQPWRFIVARRGTPEHESVHANLAGLNQSWADNAAVLIIALAELETEDGEARNWATYDLGQAMAHLSVQAHHDGLHVHQMGGFDAPGLREAFDVDSRLAIISVTALGTLGDPATLLDVLQERERAPRVRRPLAESIIVDA